MEITFEQLPQAVTLLLSKIDNLERLLKQQSGKPQPDNELWFDLAALCNYLPDSPVKPTVYGWVHSGQIPYHKRGKKLYFLKSEIDVWLKAGRRKTFAETNVLVNNLMQKGGR